MRILILILAILIITPYENAFSLSIEEAAKNENPSAQNVLGMRYLFGHKESNIKKDYYKAFQWLSKAAQHGDPMAQSNLAGMYENGYGVEKDHKMTLYWLEKAAQSGFIGAQNNLALFLYKGGENIEPDYVKSYAWLKIAANRNDEYALKSIEKLKSEMTPEQIKEGNNLSYKYFKEYSVPQKPEGK